MSTRKRAKALVMTPRFRPRRETPKKGKGSYRRHQPRIDQTDRGFLVAATRSSSPPRVWR